MTDFEAWPKTRRFEKACIVFTEKIDGTNAQIYIKDGVMKVGSRNRWITREDDNFGFANWAYDNQEELIEFLGEGRHFGEWWGQGIQRRYDMDRKVFSLFNTSRWKFIQENPDQQFICDVVPFIIRSLDYDKEELDEYFLTKSLAAAKYGVEYTNPEGYMFYTADNMYKNPVNK